MVNKGGFKMIIVFEKVKSPYKGAIKYVEVNELNAFRVIIEYQNQGYKVIKKCLKNQKAGS